MKEGICTSCVKRNVCTFTTNSESIIECDEYEGEVNGNGKKIPKDYIPYLIFETNNEGLCDTCGFREKCTYKESHSAVVQCEDFC
ncbi:MAG: hypothetical protein K6T99_06480 [Armatimonadetes bacterium]|nr:hypothetical protein [Armatimonadota bacterium]